MPLTGGDSGDSGDVDALGGNFLENRNEAPRAVATLGDEGFFLLARAHPRLPSDAQEFAPVLGNKVHLDRLPVRKGVDGGEADALFLEGVEDFSPEPGLSGALR